MKTLTIVRHAKSSWNHHGLSDHDRPLNGRGERVAPRIGRALRERDVRPGVILSSTANRALSTARLIAAEIGYPEDEIVEMREIYLASTGELLRIVAGIEEEHDSAMMFGHNPGFHDLADTLAGAASIDHFPTCAVARLELPVDHWGEVSPGDGRLIEHFYPKGIGIE